MKELYIIDAVGFIFRSYHAIRGLTNAKGQSTGALYGFIQTVQRLIKDKDPSHFVAVFDGPNNKASRLAIYPEYKANRGPCPEDLHPQIDWAEEFCALQGLPVLRVEGVEADDTMGSVAKWAEQQGFKVYVCSGDKDMAQIVTPQVHLLNLHTKNPEKAHLDPAGVEAVYGVPPQHIVDLLALTGDTSDNVPGVPGIGIKTAATLIQEYGAVPEVLKHCHQIKAKKRREALEEHGHLTDVSLRLVTLDLEVPFPKDTTYFHIASPQNESLRRFFKSMNFERLLREMGDSSAVKAKEAELQEDYRLVNSEESLQSLLTELERVDEICFDTETTHIHPMRAKLVGVGFATATAKAWYLPLNGALERSKVLEALKSVFADSSKGFFGHNCKYDCHVLANEGIHVARISYDSILASYLLHSHDRRHSLDHLVLEHMGKVKTPIEELIGKGTKQISMDQVEIDKVCTYCCEDVDYTWRLKAIQEPLIKERGLETLLYELELPLAQVLLRMERAGMYMDATVLEAQAKELRAELTTLQKDIWLEAGEEFNLNSPKQLAAILFEKMEIPPPKKTKTGYSTNAAVLESLSTDYPFVEKILQYRSLEKLRSTYVEALPQEILPRTRRIHCNFNQSVAATGRLSSTDPNLQNIPIRTPLGRRVREAFLPERKGWSYLSADYSQIELRLLAHMSEDPTLIQAFLNGEDIHQSTAAHVFHVPLNEVSKTQRYQAKAVNFGILYGQQAFGLSQQLAVSREEAESFIQTYFQRFPRVKEFLEECKEKARQTGRAITLTGRERILPEINSKNGQLRAAAERLAVNSPLQGTAADLIKMAMLRVQDRLDQEELLAFLVLQIHDELLLETPDHELIDLERQVREAMEKVWTLRVPLVVDVSVGKNWKEC
jgi:DNA polymerase-1